MSTLDSILAAHYRTLALEALDRLSPGDRSFPAKVLVVDLVAQRAGLLEEGGIAWEGPISSALAGIGSREGSYRTPPGWHRIQAQYGDGCARGMIFRSRVATGEVWRGEEVPEDLILTRVMTLEGLEPGVNQGPGVDSLERFIYLHGTNQEGRLGEPVSHGCIRFSNDGILEVFGRMAVGDRVLMAQPRGAFLGRLHFAGVAGSGMSALAQFAAMKGGRVSGSDRSFDRGERSEARARLEALGVAILPQDGGGVAGDCAGVVHSTAVEAEVPDLREAMRLGVPLVHRSELLAHFVAGHRTIAVTGTSGKSTTAAMVFEILEGAGADPSIITGGDLGTLQARGLWGNAWAGKSDLLVVEADESDGSVVRYHPAVGVVLNLQRDHKEMAEVARMFQVFRAQCREAFVLGEDARLEPLREGATVFGLGQGAQVRGLDPRETGEGSSFTVEGTAFRLPVPGRHNVENALAAIAACQAVGIPREDMADPLAAFQGVSRRFQSVGTARGVQVVDDFGHNPAKVAASLATAHLRAGRVLAVYQPHGYGPTRFLWKDFVESFSRSLGKGDVLWMLEVFYAGGTATRDFSAADLAADIARAGADARFAPSRAWLAEAVAREARQGDLVIVMGARDPSLTALAREILEALKA